MSPLGRAKAQPQPLTPPLSDRLEHQYLLPSNSASPYQPSPYEFENIPRVPSHSQTTFSSPDSRQLQIEYGHEPYPKMFHGPKGTYQNTPHGQQDLALEVQYVDQYGVPAPYYPAQNGPYNYPVRQQLYPNPPYLVSSPPTPAASNQSDGNKRKRITRTIASSTRAAKANRKAEDDEETPRKSKAKKQSPIDKSKIPKLTAPLSELTKGYEHVPIKDINAWTTRPKEKRAVERGKDNRVPRPMNSFMLYRSAYAERCKIWCTQNNHQVVSSVCGASWRLEPPEIRNLYSDYAKLERENHAIAHPDYKFSPTRPNTTGRKGKRSRSAPVDKEDDEPSDLDDPDFDYRPSAVKEGKQRAKTPGPVSSFPAHYVTQEQYSPEGENGRQRSTFHYTNPGKAPPLPLGAHQLQGQYYQSVVVPHARGQQNVEDVLVRRTDAPSVQYGPAPPVVALPGASHYELLEGELTENRARPVTEPPLDPLLSEYNANYNDPSTGFVHDQNFEDFGQAGLSYDGDPRSTAPPIEGQPATAAPDQPDDDNWEFQQVATGSGDALADFEEWMKQNNDR